MRTGKLLFLVKQYSMQWYNLVIFILMNAGVAVIVTRSSLFEPLRKKIKSKSAFFGDLVNCPLCFGFWSSLVVYFYVYRTIDIWVIGFMFLGAFTAFFLNRLSNLG